MCVCVCVCVCVCACVCVKYIMHINVCRFAHELYYSINNFYTGLNVSYIFFRYEILYFLYILHTGIDVICEH